MKRVWLWLTLGFVIFSFSGGLARPTKAQFDWLEALQPALDTVPDVIQYDTVEAYGGQAFVDTAGDYWIAVKFTPTRASFTLQVVYFQIDNSLINTQDGCSVLVATDAGGVPGTILLRNTVPPPLPNRLRSLPLSDSLLFLKNQDFWVLLGPVPSGPDSDAIGNGWWGLAAKSSTTGRSYIRYKNNSTWTPFAIPNTGTGNWVLRAGGVYGPSPQVVINEVLFAADTFSSADPSRNHEWVELYNPASVQITDGWEIVNGQGPSPLIPKSFPLPNSIQFDSGAYLVVHFAPGVNDLDLSDGRGDVYANGYPQFFKDQFFNNRKDACGFRVNNPDLSEFVDIVAWNLKNLSTDPDGDGKTTTENPPFVPLNKVWRIQPDSGLGPLLTASPGISIGRNQLGANPISSPDGGNLNFVGGPDAAGPTLGGKNKLPMVFDASSPLPAPSDPADWTLMLYMAADYGNDPQRSPDRWYYDILNQLERAVPTGLDSGKVNIVVLFDTRRAQLSSGPGTVNGTFEGALKSDLTDTVRNLTFLPFDANTGRDATLAGFISRAKSSYRASHYALALKGDGAGWQGLCGDADSSDRLEMGELKSALAAGLGVDTLLDLLILDAPLMSQLEVATQVKNFAHRMVASPEMTGPADFDYPRLVDSLTAGANTSARIVATLESILSNRTGADLFAVWTIINLDNLDMLTRSVDTLANNLKIGVEDPCGTSDNYQINIRKALTTGSTDHYGTQAQGMADFIDLRGYAIRLLQNPQYDFNCVLGHKKGADSVAYFLRKKGPVPVIEGLEGGGVAPSVGWHRTLLNANDPGGGLSIYFPSARQRAIPPLKKDFFAKLYNDSSDHPFDSPGLRTEGGLFQNHRIYALDATTCYPHTAGICSAPMADSQPFPAVADFDFVQAHKWDEFLVRYYKPVADAVAAGGTDKKLNESFDLSATGTSDPDDDFSSLSFFWDTSSTDTGPDCSDYSREDLDKDCNDNSSDDADRTGPSVTLKFSQSGDHPIWLHVWDPTDSDKPDSLRRFQTDKDVVDMRIQFRGVQTYFEDLSVKGVYYIDVLDSVGPTTGHPPHDGLDLDRLIDRVNLPLNTVLDFASFPPQSPKPQVLWSTGSVQDSTFPESCRTALIRGLLSANLDIGAVIFAPKAGGATDLTSRKYFDSLGFTFSPGLPQTTSFIHPDARGNSVFLFGQDSFPVLGGVKSLRYFIGDTCRVFPILKTDSGKIVAAARVLVPRRHGIVFCSFGMEDLDIFSDRVFVMDKILSWLSSPTTPESLSICCVKGDVNQDGTKSPADAVAGANRIFLGTGGDSCAADVNCKDGLTPADMTILLQMIFNAASDQCSLLRSEKVYEAVEDEVRTVVDWKEPR